MNENLNLVAILKDCPKGTKLYSTAFGEVELDYVDTRSNYPIVIRTEGRELESFTTEGKFCAAYNGECILFPSRGQRDWSKFKPKQYRLAPISEFKDGDILATNSGLQVFILQTPKSDLQGNCHVGYDFETNEFFFSRELKFVRFATEEEKQKLFDAIKERVYKWNAETKTLEKLVKPKFDPKTLNSFDRVICKNGSAIWRCDLFSFYLEGSACPNVCVSCSYSHCIPYNEDTKHLVGTDDKAPEYYRYWED